MRPLVPVQTVTISNASPAVVTTTLAAHTLTASCPVVFSTTGALPAGLTVGTPYYVIAAGLTTTAFEVATTIGGTAINTTTAGSGVHTISPTAQSVTGSLGAAFDPNIVIWADNTATATFLVSRSRNRDVEFYTAVSGWASIGSAVNAIYKAQTVLGFQDAKPYNQIPTIGNTFTWETSKTVTMTETKDIGGDVFRDPAGQENPRIIKLTIA
jgi:hypothetical protein